MVMCQTPMTIPKRGAPHWLWFQWVFEVVLYADLMAFLDALRQREVISMFSDIVDDGGIADAR